MKKIFKDFSLILSVYNKTDPYLLTKSFKSILNQYFLPNEILIMLDGPLKVRQSFIINSFISKNRKKIKIKIFRNKQNLGIAVSYNKLISNTCNEIIAIQDSDDVSSYMRFYYQYNLLSTLKKYSVIGSNVYENDILEQKKTQKKMPSSYRFIKKRCKLSNPINHPTVMFKKKDLLKYNYENFHRMEDYYLWIRMLSDNIFFMNIDKYLVTMNLDKNFFLRRKDFKILINELKIQKLLFKHKFNNFFEMILLTVIKIIYHVFPNNLKKILRKNLLSFFSKNQK